MVSHCEVGSGILLKTALILDTSCKYRVPRIASFLVEPATKLQDSPHPQQTFNIQHSTSTVTTTTQRTQESAVHAMRVYFKGYKHSQMKKHIGQGPEVPQVQEPQSRWSWGMPPSQHMDVFANSESPPNPIIQVFFMEVSLFKHACGHCQWTQSPGLPPFPDVGEEGVGRMKQKIPRFWSTLDLSGDWLLPWCYLG